MWMRGGTSKGGFFLASDLPSDEKARNDLLLNIMGSPDSRQIDGMGGADPLTSKVAIVQPSDREGVDVEYLFLQVLVDKAEVFDGQNCGNMLAGVGPFAIERGLVAAKADETDVTIFQKNSEQIAVATVQTPQSIVTYRGTATIDGAPGSAAPVLLEFSETAGSTCGALLPTGRVTDHVNGVDVTLIDNGMPSVIINAASLGISGAEDCSALMDNQTLRNQLEALRMACGSLMNLGDVSAKTVPKMVMVSAPQHGGAITTRSFIPHKCHMAIGVLGAVSVATACLLKGSVAQPLAAYTEGEKISLAIEHPSGELSVVATMAKEEVKAAAVLRTANKLMDGRVFA